MRFAVLVLLTLLAVVVVGTVLYIRFASHPPEVYHVDPLTAPTPNTPNSFRVAPVVEGLDPVTDERIDMPAPFYEANPALIASALDDFALAQPETYRIAGTPEQGWMTYVQLSPTMRYPDYVSVLVIEIADAGLTTVAIFSRSRFGHGDLGVNQARVKRWLGTLSSFEVTLE
jgi:uncharacterized protein (DUF1499 family)